MDAQAVPCVKAVVNSSATRLSGYRQERPLWANAIRYGHAADIAVTAAPDAACITIDDHGPGFTAQYLESAFLPLFRVDPSRSRGTGGAGLGLYIARDLMARQNDTVTLTNRPEGGLRAALRIRRKPPGED